MTVPSLDVLAARLADRRVLLTGHTGFKGSWLALWLHQLGAHITGFALDPPSKPSLFDLAGVGSLIDDRRGDICDTSSLAAAYAAAQPDVVLHLAAQPIVRASYTDPVATFATNVIGTARVLDLARQHRTQAVVVITTDKVYENREWAWGYREVDQLGGSDPYSASKACAELVTTSFRRSFFTSDGGPGVTAVASARAGNVIGGGDWAADRIIPDFVRAIASGQPVRLRNPGAVRPWQHVIESLSGYITLAGLLLGNEGERRVAAQEWNFGPQPASGTATVLAIAEQCCAAYGAGTVEVGQADPAAKESQLLTLCIDKAEQQLGWHPRWSVSEAVEHTMSWYRQVADGADAGALCRAQLASYLAG